MVNFPTLKFRRRLLAWFRANGRSLPWRETNDPYAVWVSEIMLQQTTTETVRGYFPRFLERFPTVERLAAADSGDVLTLWQGLGYYRRAEQMRLTAKIVVERFGGRFPRTVEELRTLPGIGRYTAGAIRSFAFDLPAPILEANTGRLYARLTASEAAPNAASAQRELWDFAERLIPRRGCGDFNQALIDLGNAVCLPNAPNCPACPVFEWCEAHRRGLTDVIPPPKKKREMTYRREAAVLVRESLFGPKKSARFLLIQYPEGVRWAGLWDFPRFEISGDSFPTDDSQLVETLSRFLGRPVRFAPLGRPIRHVVTRYKIELSFGEAVDGDSKKSSAGSIGRAEPFWLSLAHKRVSLRFAGGTATAETVVFRYVTLAEAAALPLSTTGRQLLERLKDIYR